MQTSSSEFRAAGLEYAHLDRPGIRRARRGDQWAYFDHRGRRMQASTTLERIRALTIPPAWTDVWICPLVRGHIQAVGRDARGRRQYRYHDDWRAARDETKFHRTLAFGRALPRIRRKVARDLRRKALDRRKVLAAVVRLLETTLIRVGNEEYARENHSFGVTTLRPRHARLSRGREVHLDFRGKSGRFHHIVFSDPRLTALIRRLRDLPGQHLFHFRDEFDRLHPVTSEAVNDYIHEAAREPFSAKDFRTWAGTVLAAKALEDFEPFRNQRQARRNIVAAVARVAERLGNTPAVCRRSYIHPEVLGGYLDGTTAKWLRRQGERKVRGALRGLNAIEWAVLAFLSRRAREAPGSEPAGPLRV